MFTFGAIFIVTLPLLFVENGIQAAPDVSHEDIRDAILSLVSIFRDNSDKLERHEYRERQLGEQLKKALAGLDKRYKSQDQNIEKLGALMVRFDERMKNFEMMTKQRDERERIQLQKSHDAIEDVQVSISKLMKELQGFAKDSTTTYTIQDSDRQQLEAIEAAIISKVDVLSSKVEQLQRNVIENRANVTSNSLEIDADVKKSIKESERILQKYDKIFDEEPKLDNTWLLDFSSDLKSQKETINDILQVSKDTRNGIGNLPTKEFMQELNNETRDALQEVKEELIEVSDQGVRKVNGKIEDGMSGLKGGQEEVIKAISDLQSTGESFYSDVSKSYEQLLGEIKGLSKIEQVMIQTADNVLDTKRRIEYGIQEILLEVGDLVKIQSKSLNSTINRRSDDIEETILENQSGALTNLSSKIETEISQVWRQIGIMYQQLTASADTLDKLQQQTDTYVNGSVKTMNSMDGKVIKVTTKMSEVEENLNYLIGKLSVVTSEFNQIKSGLASALDNIRNSFIEARNDIKDSGPGPKPIDNDILPQSDSSS